jgi:hypothetical protein
MTLLLLTRTVSIADRLPDAPLRSVGDVTSVCVVSAASLLPADVVGGADLEPGEDRPHDCHEGVKPGRIDDGEDVPDNGEAGICPDDPRSWLTDKSFKEAALLHVGHASDAI